MSKLVSQPKINFFLKTDSFSTAKLEVGVLNLYFVRKIGEINSTTFGNKNLQLVDL